MCFRLGRLAIVRSRSLVAPSASPAVCRSASCRSHTLALSGNLRVNALKVCAKSSSCTPAKRLHQVQLHLTLFVLLRHPDCWGTLHR